MATDFKLINEFKFITLTGGSRDPDTWGLPCTPRVDKIFNIQSMRDVHPNERDPENPFIVPISVVWCYEGMFKVQETLPVIKQKIKEALEDKSNELFILSKSTPEQHQQFLKNAGVEPVAEPKAIPYQPSVPVNEPVKKGVLAGLFKGNGENYD